MDVALLSISLFLTVILPYQLSVVIRCVRLVKKGGQHYVVPEEELKPVKEEDGTSVITMNTEEEMDSKM